MGCNIHAYVEIWDGENWVYLDRPVFEDQWPGLPSDGFHSNQPFGAAGKSYGLFGFLAGVRNRDVPSLGDARGLPADISQEVRRHLGCSVGCENGTSSVCNRPYTNCTDLHSRSWWLASELVGYDFDIPFEYTWSGETRHTVGEFLGDWVDRFHQIAALADDPAHVRVVFAFDS